MSILYFTGKSFYKLLSQKGIGYFGYFGYFGFIMIFLFEIISDVTELTNVRCTSPKHRISEKSFLTVI